KRDWSSDVCSSDLSISQIQIFIPCQHEIPSFNNISDFPRDLLFSAPGIPHRQSPVSVSHWKISADGKPHGICNNRNPQSIPPAAACCENSENSSDTSVPLCVRFLQES